MSDLDESAVAAVSDAALIESITRAGLGLSQSAKEKLASIGSIAEDPRWESSPLPLRFELQLAILFLGALDAYDVVASLLRARASQQAFSALRYQMESVAAIRWLVEPNDPKEMQHRAYSFLCGQLSRSGKFMLKDAGRDRDALDVVRRARESGRRLRDIATQDGFPSLKEAPQRKDLIPRYLDERAKPRFDMLSEFGSHPGLIGLTLFAVQPETTELKHDLHGGHVARAFWIAVAIWQLWDTCEAVSRVGVDGLAEVRGASAIRGLRASNSGSYGRHREHNHRFG